MVKGEIYLLTVAVIGSVLIDEYFYTNVTPVIEETVKVFPVLFYLIFYKSDRKALLENTMAVGIGLAIPI